MHLKRLAKETVKSIGLRSRWLAWLALFLGISVFGGCQGQKNKLPDEDTLKQARALDLTDLGLQSVPLAIKGNPNLSDLNLSHNQLKSIPDWLWQLPQLKRVTLDFNALDSLNVPGSAVVSELSAHHNRLAKANFNGAFLEHLDLAQNRLTEIALDSNCRRLTYLQLSNNNLKALWLPKPTKALLVDSNELTQLTAALGTEVEVLSANQNQIARLTLSLANARHLYLESNQLRFWSPGNYPMLRVLKLRGNRLQAFGKIEAPSLELLDLGATELQSFNIQSLRAPMLRSLFINDGILRSIQGRLSELPQLRTLDLGSNQLKSIALSESGPHLARLDLSENQLREIPNFLKATVRIRYLRLENNRLSTLPAWMQTLPHLERVWLQNNYLTAFPTLLLGHAPLQLANLSNNPFKKIPDTMAVGGQLGILYLHRVGMSKVPAWIFNCKGVDILGLAENPIDEWPDGLSKLTRMRMLHWQKSGLTTLPATLPKFPRLEKIDMRKTKLSQASIQKLKKAYGNKVKFSEADEHR